MRATSPHLAPEAIAAKYAHDGLQKPVMSFDDVARIYNQTKRRRGEVLMTREHARWIVNNAIKRLRERLTDDPS